VEPAFAWKRSRRLLGFLARQDWAPLLLVSLVATAWAVFFFAFGLSNHRSFRTASFDLGIEENVLWNAAHLRGPPFRTTPLGPPYTHLGFHQTWISYLIAPLYRLYPRAEFLLLLQAVVVALAAFPLFFLARRWLGQWWAFFFTAGYLAYAPLHGSVLYDFHYQPFASVLLFTIAYAVVAKRTWLSVLATVLLLAVR